MADPEKRSSIPLYSTIDSDANANTKTFTVPAGNVWHLLWLHLIYVSTATAGNRQVDLQVYDDSDNLMLEMHAGAVQAASNTYHYSFLQGAARETTVVDNALLVPLPDDLWLDSGWYITVLDSTDVDSNDDMTISLAAMHYAR